MYTSANEMEIGAGICFHHIYEFMKEPLGSHKEP